jgi:hypothetical protein
VKIPTLFPPSHISDFPETSLNGMVR